MSIVLGDAELQARAARLAARVVAQPPDASSFDLLYGKAGAIAALVLLHNLLDAPALLDAATRLGDALLATAEHDAAGASWRATHQAGHNWTGMSHGTAGAAYALIELFQATGQARYHQAAGWAFAYERHWFDAATQNWADFPEKLPRRRSVRPPSHAVYWCHGAAGITLSRLRAYELSGDGACHTEALAGLRTTGRAIEAALSTGAGNYSLCHGLAGQAEVLRYGSAVLGDAAADETALVHRLATAGVRQFGAEPTRWPCGTMSGGQTLGSCWAWPASAISTCGCMPRPCHPSCCRAPTNGLPVGPARPRTRPVAAVPAPYPQSTLCHRWPDSPPLSGTARQTSARRSRRRLLTERSTRSLTAPALVFRAPNVGPPFTAASSQTRLPHYRCTIVDGVGYAARTPTWPESL